MSVVSGWFSIAVLSYMGGLGLVWCMRALYRKTPAHAREPVSPPERHDKRIWQQKKQSSADLRHAGYEAVAYLQAFGVPPSGCCLCGEGLRKLYRLREVRSPYGELFVQRERAGYVCLRCGVAGDSDVGEGKPKMPIPEWANQKRSKNK